MGNSVGTVGVLDKSAAVIDAVAAFDGPCHLADIVAATDLSRATAHRLAVALVGHGLLRRAEGGGFALGARLIGLGRAAAQDWPLADLARPALEELRTVTGESAQLYVRDGDHRICLVSLESRHELRTIVEEGSRLPLDVGSAGRLLSGQVSEAASSGWSASVEERAPGVASVSAPVSLVDGTVVAAVGISGPVGRLGHDPGSRHGPPVAHAARRIAHRLATGADLADPLETVR